MPHIDVNQPWVQTTYLKSLVSGIYKNSLNYVVRNQTISWESQQNIWTDTWAKIHSCPLWWPWLSGRSLSSGRDTVPSGSAQRPLCQVSIYVGWKPHSSRVHPRPGKARPPRASATPTGPAAFSAGPCGDRFKRSFLTLSWAYGYGFLTKRGWIVHQHQAPHWPGWSIY